MKTLAILGDRPTAATGFAVVLGNLASHLAHMSDDLRVLYFARFGLWRCLDCGKFFPFDEIPICPFCNSQNVTTKEVGFSSEYSSIDYGYKCVPTEGGVWREELVDKIIETYNPDILFSEDDWWSAYGMVASAQRHKVPFYFYTPIDGLPLSHDAHQIFRRCEKVFVPNSAYKLVKNGHFLLHGVNSKMFTPLPKEERHFDKFTFLWNGRDEIRKAMGRAILAFKKAYTAGDCQMVIRTSWNMPTAKRTLAYIRHHPEIPILTSKMTNCPHAVLREIYGNCHVLVITSKGGGFEMQSTEAMACEVPILCTDWTFMSEQIVDGKNGWLIPISSYHMTGNVPTPYGEVHAIRRWGNISIPKLAEKMRWMINNQSKAERMGKWARKYVIKRYSWAKIAKGLYLALGLE